MDENKRPEEVEENCDALDAESKVEGAAEKGALCVDALETHDVFENAEPWDPIETKVVLGSFGAALFLLALFGYLIHKFLLT